MILYHWICFCYVPFSYYRIRNGLEFFLVTFVSYRVITRNVFSIRYFRQADFYMHQKNPVTCVSYWKCLNGWLIIELPLLQVLHSLQGVRWPRSCSCYLHFFLSYHSWCIFHLLLLLHWFLHQPEKACYISFILRLKKR